MWWWTASELNGKNWLLFLKWLKCSFISYTELLHQRTMRSYNNHFHVVLVFTNDPFYYTTDPLSTSTLQVGHGDLIWLREYNNTVYSNNAYSFFIYTISWALRLPESWTADHEQLYYSKVYPVKRGYNWLHLLWTSNPCSFECPH